MFDPFKITFDISPNNTITTYKPPPNSRNKPSRIDYIWSTEHIFMQLQDTTIIDLSDFIKTDHHLLIFNMD
jgi:hypothetical protein